MAAIRESQTIVQVAWRRTAALRESQTVVQVVRGPPPPLPDGVIFYQAAVECLIKVTPEMRLNQAALEVLIKNPVVQTSPSTANRAVSGST